MEDEEHIPSPKLQSGEASIYLLLSGNLIIQPLHSGNSDQQSAKCSIFPNDHQCAFWITEENNHKVSALPTFTENTLTAHKLRLTHAYIHLLTYSSSSVSPIGRHIPEWHVLSIRRMSLSPYHQLQNGCLTWATHSLIVPKEWIYEHQLYQQILYYQHFQHFQIDIIFVLKCRKEI